MLVGGRDSFGLVGGCGAGVLLLASSAGCGCSVEELVAQA
jgi:hypothetical protein